MKQPWLALVVAPLVGACLLTPQVLESPCDGQPVSVDGGACPACASDADCTIATNRCYATAQCVPAAGNWGVTLLGCSVQHAPTTQECRCVQSVCRAQ